MNLSFLFIRRPVTTSLLMAGLATFGVLAYAALPVSDLPSVDFPTLSITGSLPGADPETMAATVASPLERQFSAIAGLDSMTSASALGSSAVTLQFDLSQWLRAAKEDPARRLVCLTYANTTLTSRSSAQYWPSPYRLGVFLDCSTRCTAI